MRTKVTKGSEIHHAWHLVDAEGQVLGRLAVEVARLLRGRHKPDWSPHLDSGDHVVVVNADKVVLTGKKADQKLWYRFSGYPGGLRSTPYREVMTSRPTEVVRKAVRGMLPRNRLGRRMLRKVRIYEGPDHPHVGQAPAPFDLKSRSTKAA